MGSAGSILLLWDSMQVTASGCWRGLSSISVMVEDMAKKSSWLFTLDYGPHSHSQRGNFWNELFDLRNRWGRPWCIRGDWNVVRYPSDNTGGKITMEMRQFSDWFNHHSH